MTTYVVQWQRNGVDIPGATGATYTLTEIDVGHTVTSVVIANRDGESAMAASRPVGPVTAQS